MGNRGGMYTDSSGNALSGDGRPASSVDDPYESSDYAAFVESMADRCHCDPDLRPCAACLAGGPCDDIHRDDDCEGDDQDDSMD